MEGHSVSNPRKLKPRDPMEERGHATEPGRKEEAAPAVVRQGPQQQPEHAGVIGLNDQSRRAARGGTAAWSSQPFPLDLERPTCRRNGVSKPVARR